MREMKEWKDYLANEEELFCILYLFIGLYNAILNI
jgi:hypothetical protein